MIVSHDSGNELPGEAFSMILVGKEKSGKSQLAATAPAPVLFLDSDQRAGSLTGIKGVYAITFSDNTAGDYMPTGFNELTQVLTCLEKSRKLRDIAITVAQPWTSKAPEVIKPFANITDDRDVATVVFDSIATLGDLARRYALYAAEKELAYSIKIGTRVHRSPRTWHGWESEKGFVIDALNQARAVSKLNTIVTLHECMEEDERSTEDNPIYTGKIEVYPRRYNAILKYFDEVWRLTRKEGQIPKIDVQPTNEFTPAATALGVYKIAVPNIVSILKDSRSMQKKTA